MTLRPAQLLRDHVSLLTDNLLPGPVLDMACGDGRNGIFLATHNLPVICCDNSQAALERARKSAAEQEVTVTLWQVNLEQEGVNPLPDDCYGGVLVFHYLHRPLIPCIKKALKQGGILIYETFTIEQPKFGKPYNPDFLLRPKELFEWFNQWEVIHYFEGIKEDPRRAIAQIVCRKVS
jgi:SAM-dependent methyltransferase